MTPDPTPEQKKAAKKVIEIVNGSRSPLRHERTARKILDFLIARDAAKDEEIKALKVRLIGTNDWDGATHADQIAAKDREIAELRKESNDNRMEYSAAKGAAISFRLRAEQAEALVAEIRADHKLQVEALGKTIAELRAVILSGWGPKPEHIQRAEQAEAELAAEKQATFGMSVSGKQLEKKLRHAEADLAAMTKERDELEAAYQNTLKSITPEHQNKIIVIQKKMIDALEIKIVELRELATEEDVREALKFAKIHHNPQSHYSSVCAGCHVVVLARVLRGKTLALKEAEAKIVALDIEKAEAMAALDIKENRCGFTCPSCSAFYTPIGYGRPWHRKGCAALDKK